ncbi:selenocysteine lyase/cysteine desulfurase [Cryobacterium mesophilum]|uniref:Aminotransferase class V-fold PLP-dependent enzyme n=1 Tax=Terrimesophilobacter mesophilus TaxID=433647 RepID=A0A4R8V7J4_9MICO|nr:aminotransferase class V-fold PLP-dependent enzyme [Terrimesophilobacter mesophilus]MBB5632241.1 selenocysteine lyase/cysteine desulfurase [Terrimesophilobacter mesophilus]TFB79094.1 aminotransferase class V-fold PLP-dependent enzyme [Terrimesophilobacter mesophilus]
MSSAQASSTVAATSRRLSPALTSAIGQFRPDAARGYLAVASIGLPTRATVAAQLADIELWASGTRDPMDYDPIHENTRRHYATLVKVDPERVATGSQTSVMASVFAAAVPDGAEVLCAEGDFSSIMFPFLQRSGIRVRTVPLDELAASITDRTWLVVFSLAQSATGRIADLDGIVAAARRTGTYTVCDLTQAAGVYPADASRFDATLCHAYKWLCSPRGVAFMTLSERFQAVLTPIQAGWYAGDDVWGSCYGPAMDLAASARRFDVSPAWPAWVGAEPALELFSGLDMDEVWNFTVGLGDLLCDALEIPQQHQPIVTWADADHKDMARLVDAGITVSGRAGRLRASIHLWNDESDVAAVAKALR